MRAVAVALLAAGALSAANWSAIGVRPDATIDLATREGARLAGARWRYAEARISSTPPAFDYTPKGGGRDFDDSAWEQIDATTLDTRRGAGKLSFVWYRVRVTIPEKVGAFRTEGATVALETVVDDYAEIWVDGKLPRVLGQQGGNLAAGWNAPNRVVLTRHAQPGQQIQLAIFAANGPLSDLPENFIWIRSATLDFYKNETPPAQGKIVRVDPAIDEIVPPDARIEKLAGGFLFTEGPVWDRENGHLLFSDPNANRIYRWSADGEVSTYRVKSGYSGFDIGEYGQPGSNGLTFDKEGRLTVAEHGNRRITRIEKKGAVTVLADRFEGKRLNSPNDLVYRSDGTLYFTDPPFGLPKFFEDARKQLPFSGVFMLRKGILTLQTRVLRAPNGLAFSPDERFLYVSNWDDKQKVILRFPVAEDGTLGEPTEFFNMNGAPGEEALDGVKVDVQGNVYASGPGGVWIIAPSGKHLGTIVAPELPANFAWGDADGRTLYMTARTGLYRVRLNLPGVRP